MPLMAKGLTKSVHRLSQKFPLWRWHVYHPKLAPVCHLFQCKANLWWQGKKIKENERTERDESALFSSSTPYHQVVVRAYAFTPGDANLLSYFYCKANLFSSSLSLSSFFIFDDRKRFALQQKRWQTAGMKAKQALLLSGITMMTGNGHKKN